MRTLIKKYLNKSDTELKEVYQEVLQLEEKLINAIDEDNQEESCRLEMKLRYRLETLETLMTEHKTKDYINMMLEYESIVSYLNMLENKREYLKAKKK